MVLLDFSFLTVNAGTTLVRGMLVSLQVAGAALGVGLVWGTLLAIMRLSRWRPLVWFSALYVSLFRAVPLAMVLLGFYLVVPQMVRAVVPGAGGMDTRMMSALVGFSLFESAYYAEIVRAGIQSVPRAQFLAASALGMSHSQALRLVILPQSFRNMVPLLLTQLIVLFQDTSIVYVISLADFFTAAEGVGERDGRVEEMMVIASIVYFAICFIASRAVQQLIRKPIR